MVVRTLTAVLLAVLTCGWACAQNPPVTNADAARAQAETQRSNDNDVIYRETRRGKTNSPDSDLSPSFNKETIERIKQFRKIDPQVAAAYAEFTKAPDTGITKIFANNGCQLARVVDASDKCRDFIPQSYAFSFRTKGYVGEPYGDITLYRNGIFTGGFFAQSAIVSIGNVPVENVDTNNPAVKLLAALPPDKDFDAAKEAAQRLKQGYSSDGMTVSTVMKAAVNTTYVIRVIAYRPGVSVPPLSERSTTMEKWFLSLGNDTRGDILALFRIVDVQPDGAMTVVWKLLERKDAPKLKFGKDEPLADFRP